MQTSILLVALVAILTSITLVIILLRRRGSETKPGEGMDAVKLVLDQMNANMHELSRTLDRKVGDLTKTVDSKISDSSRSMQESVRVQLSESSKLIREVTQGLTKLDETNKQVVSFADQIQNLQDIFKNPKHRGVVAEYYLETLLKNVLPPSGYMMQYHQLGKDEEGRDLIPDAVVFVKDKIIAVDSKFSLENYNKMIEAREPADKERFEKLFVADLKNRIIETSKYIQPSKNTMDFAFMFIPHEAIYYDLLINKVGAVSEDNDNLIQRAAGKYKVIIVSPTSFLAYLQTVLQGLKAMQIEETAKDIIKRVGELGTHLKKYEEYHIKLGTSLSTVVNHYNGSTKELKKVDKDVLRITGSAPGIDIPLVEKPEIGE